MFLNAAILSTGRASAGARQAALSLGAVSLCAIRVTCTIGVTCAVGVAGIVAVPAMSAARADPVPSARDMERGRERVRERAAEMGRTKARLAQADSDLERLAAASALAVERYNGEVVKLERSRVAYQDARLRVEEADRRIAVHRAELAAFAADAYRANTGVNPWSAVVAGEGGPQGFMDRAAIVEMLAQRRAGAVQRVEAARGVADLFRRQARAAFDERRRATERAEAARRAAELAVDRQHAAVQEIEAEKRRLERRLERARARAEEIQRERQAALGRAEERGVRQAIRRALQTAPGTVPGRALSGSSRGAVVVRAALKWLGTPYSWGGGNANGPSYGIARGAHIHGFDCSGLALHAWSKAGVRLDHWTGTQWTSGPRVPLNRLRPGDLVFFAHDTSDPDTIHHVGIYIGEGRMVEAPYTGARVRIASIWRNGLIGATRPAAAH